MKKLVALILLASSIFSLPAEDGIASWYTAEKSALTANGESFDGSALTGAHKSLKFGTRVLVTNLDNGKSLVVRINDRGPFVDGRILDLTEEGARVLGYYDEGLARVSLEVVHEPEIAESEYLLGEETGWYTLQIGTYADKDNADAMYERILACGLDAEAEVLAGGMRRISVPHVQASKLEEVMGILESAGVTEILVKGAENPYN